MERQPGAFVKNGDEIKPDLNDEAMKARHDGEKPKIKKEVGDVQK
jgi:hypothetical protein